MERMGQMKVSSIRIGNRVRRDMGDIKALAASIREHGLLHPVVVTSDGLLVAGHRRIQACAALGMTKIPVRVIDVANLLSAERDENQIRKDFTPSEAVAVARAIEAELKAASHARRSAGAKARWARERGEEINVAAPPTSTRNLSVSTAAVVGMGRHRYEQAKEVAEAAEQNAEKFGDLVEMMDATGNVRGAYTELCRRRDKLPARHAVHRGMRHRNPNQEIERAITTLAGLAIGVGHIDVAGLDAARVGEWSAELKRQLAVINRFMRKLSDVI